MLTTLSSLLLAAIPTLTSGGETYTFAYDTPPTPPCFSEFHVFVGQTFTFPISVTSTDPNDIIGFVLMDSPAGGDVNPDDPIVAYGNGVDPVNITTTYSWTPTAGQVGENVVIFDSANLAGARLVCGYKVFVHPKLEGCTRTQGGWGAKPSGNNAGALLKKWFSTVYPSGVEIGVAGAAGYSAKFTSAAAIEKFLPAGATPGVLTGDKLNPLTTPAGVFAGQVLALQLNVDFSAAGKLGPTAIGTLQFLNTGNANLDGKTVADVLADANKVLGGGALPSYVTSVSDFNDLVTDLNEGFDNCTVTDWAYHMFSGQ